MIDKLKVFEVAWAEFVEWLYTKHGDYPFVYERGWGIKRKNEFISDRELHSLCIEWLDSKGIIITSRWYFDNSESYKGTYEYELWEFPEDHCCRFTSNGYDNRNQGKEETIIRAFEILNQRGEK